jgi:hypothetical protein
MATRTWVASGPRAGAARVLPRAGLRRIDGGGRAWCVLCPAGSAQTCVQLLEVELKQEASRDPLVFPAAARVRILRDRGSFG